MLYDPVNSERDIMATRTVKPLGDYGVASRSDFVNPKALPKRLLEDEEKGLIFKLNSPEFQNAFDRRAAQWLSADCHRSQYGYPFRVSIGLALENRHRAVTFVSLACSGADIVEGLFSERDSREQFSGPNGQKQVVAQFDQLSDLICRNGAAGRTRAASYRLPVYSSGSTSISEQVITKQWCPPESRKRGIDVVLLSVGGNDVGFGALVTYAMTESASDIAPIVGLIGHELRFSPAVSQTYLRVLDRRLKAVKDALSDGFGVDPSRVLQNAYEPIQFDETGDVCGTLPTLGLDVHPKLRFSRERTQEVSGFVRELQGRLECISDSRRPNCPAGLATGTGTGFKLITDHIAEFAKRGVCARDQHGHAAHVPGGRQLPALFAGGRAALRPSLAARPQSERHLPGRQHPPGRPLAVRRPAPALCGALQLRIPPDRRRPRHRGRPRAAPCQRIPRQADTGAELSKVTQTASPQRSSRGGIPRLYRPETPLDRPNTCPAPTACLAANASISVIVDRHLPIILARESTVSKSGS
jgi:hypothetical protein